MATWVVGDVHGCAEELAALLEQLALGAGDRLALVGDLFHRGPDALGVLEILRERQAAFVLGNHELAVLRRIGLAPSSARSPERPALRTSFPPIDEQDLAGDGATPCRMPRERRVEMLLFLQRHSGFVLRPADLSGAGPTADGRSWCIVHAGLLPGIAAEENSVRHLTTLRHLETRGQPWWYEGYLGPELVLFGHTPSRLPRVHTVRGQVLAIGLDTGCVYGGRLTAYSPELDEFASVAAVRTYAAA